MDGDRPLVDGRDLLESELQNLVRIAFETGWDFRNEGLPNPECCMYAEREEAYRMLDKHIHELLISYLDGPTSDVGSQDEVSEEGAMGDGVRSESYIDSSESFRYSFKEFNSIDIDDISINESPLRQLMTKKPYKFEILKGGRPVFKLWNLPQNLE